MSRDSAPFQALLERVDDVVWLAEGDGSAIRYINAACARVYGYPPSAFLERAGLWEEVIHPEDRDRVVAEAGRLHEVGRLEQEYRIIRPNGEARWLLDRKFLEFDEAGQPLRMGGIATDVTALKRAEQALRERKERYRILVDHAPVCIHEIDLDGRIRTMNRAGLEMLCMTAEDDIAGTPYLDLVAPGDRSRIETLLRRALQGQPSVFEFRGAGGGVPRYFSSSFVPLRNAGGEVSGIMGVSQDITERRVAEEALRESERQVKARMAELEHLYRTTPVGLCLMDRDLRFVRINDTLARINGIPAGDHLGKRIEELIPGLAPSVMPIARRVLETGVPEVDFEVRGNTPANPGRPHVWMVSYHPHRDPAGVIQGVSTVVQDITPLVEAREEVRQLNLAVEHAMQGISRLDPQGRFVMVREAFARMLGYDPEELIGQSWEATVHPDDHARAVEAVQVMLREGRAEVELRGLRKDGTPFDKHLLLVRSQGSQGQYDGHFCFMRDITERKEAERARERVVRELEAKNAELERFTYTVSHDLKSPLVTIKNFLGLIEQDAQAGDLAALRRDLAHVGRAADTMHQLLTELLELSRIGRIVNPPEPVDLNALVAEVVAMQDGRIAEAGATVTVAPDLPEVFGDRVRLREVFDNLLENALKFARPGEAPRVTISARRDGDRVLCVVHDEGIGIAPAYHDKVFDLFERLNPEVPGTGVGLTLVRRIVEVHGGVIDVDSAPGQGAAFRFTLPVPPAG